MPLTNRRGISRASQAVPFGLALVLLAGATGTAFAAPANRITHPVDDRLLWAVPGSIHRLAQAQFDQGPIDPQMRMNYIMLIVKPSPAQQAELDGLLADQQNPSSPQFHKWLTPEEFGNRFGLSAADSSKVAAWLRAEGLTVNRLARAQNWLAFSGTAGQVSKTLHTSFHSFQVDGETHFANTTAPSVPAALADVVGGFLGLNDFHLKSFARLVPAALPSSISNMGPDDTSGSSHYLAPQDFATIYDIGPLYKQQIDGIGQSIAVVGDSDVLLTDIDAFRARYGLPVNDPLMIPYSDVDPGFNGSQVEGTLDLEWAGAIAPNATVYYVYGSDVFEAVIFAVDNDIAPIISISYGGCEVDFSISFYRSIAQEGNAEGITLLNASGDSGAAGCDQQGSEPFATRGLMVDFPAVMPEVTGVGGTEFVEGSGKYWSSVNSADFGSALSYIPEAAWNESGGNGLGAGGGGASLFYAKPAWQAGPGMPNDSARDVPDVALSAAGHDAYNITLSGKNVQVAGTSCAAPSMAGIVALLNQYQVTKGFQAQPGLGNINPQLYRLAQSSPSPFHDVTSGNNIVPCAQGSPNCLTGSFGYQAGPRYDQATGLGSVDVSALATAWNTAVNAANVNLSLSAPALTLNDTLNMVAVVAAASGKGTPTGRVDFSSGGLALGSGTLSSTSAGQAADLSFPAFMLGLGPSSITAVYSGDGAFSGSSATQQFQVNAPPGAAILVTWPNTVWPSPPDALGLSWQTSIQLNDVAGVPAMVTSFTIDGQVQPLAQYFPSSSIPANGTVSVVTVFRNLAAPVTRTFAFAGVDSSGNTWSRTIPVEYMPVPPGEHFTLSATPLTVTQNTTADPACQWAVQLNIDDVGGYLNFITNLYNGGVDASSLIPSTFGTTLLDSYGDAQGTLCFGGITPPATDTVLVLLDDAYGQEVNISFSGPPANPGTLAAAPPSLSLAVTQASATTLASLTVNLSDQTQAWTASIFPANRTTAWLTASKLSGTGSGQIALTASGAGFEPGVYRATIVIQSQNAQPQYINVPVMFVLSGSASGTAIGGIANAASFQSAVSPGMLLSVFGTQLANTTASASGNPLPFSTNGVSATVNGLAAPILFESPTQLNIQVPYTTGAGPAVLGVNNNGQIAGFQFQLSPSAPGIFADSNGNLAPNLTVQQGGITTLYFTGAGVVSPQIKTAFAPSSQTPVTQLPAPLLPLSVTVGGVPAFVYFGAIGPGLIGTTQVNFLVPASVPVGVQPLVVTVNGVASKAVNLAVTASK
jgi:uncharacterized protein (TIGR03437 family)